MGLLDNLLRLANMQPLDLSDEMPDMSSAEQAAQLSARMPSAPGAPPIAPVDSNILANFPQNPREGLAIGAVPSPGGGLSHALGRFAGPALKLGVGIPLGATAITALDTLTTPAPEADTPEPPAEIVQSPGFEQAFERAQQQGVVPPTEVPDVQTQINEAKPVFERAGVDLSNKQSRDLLFRNAEMQSPEVGNAMQQLSEMSGMSQQQMLKEANQILDLGLNEGLHKLIGTRDANSEELRQLRNELKNPKKTSMGKKIGLALLFALPVLANALRGRGEEAQRIGQFGADTINSLEAVDRQRAAAQEKRFDMLLSREADINKAIGAQAMGFSDRKRMMAESIARFEEKAQQRIDKLDPVKLDIKPDSFERAKKVAALIMQGNRVNRLETALIKEVQNSMLPERAATGTKTLSLKPIPIAGPALDKLLLNFARSDTSQQYLSVQEPFAQYVASSLEPRTTDEDRAIQQIVNFISPGDSLETARAKRQERNRAINTFISGLGRKEQRVLSSLVYNAILEERGYIDDENVKATDMGVVMIKQDSGGWKTMQIEDYVKLVNQVYGEDINERLLFEVD